MPISQPFLPFSGGMIPNKIRPLDVRDVVISPAVSGVPNSAGERARFYEYMRAYYNNTVFEDIAAWARYKLRYGLYKHTRSIFNPVQRIVDFYVDHIYSGAFPHPGSKLPPGIPNALPFSNDTPEPVRQVVAQLVQWSNWEMLQSRMVNFAAMTGNCLVQVVDDSPNQSIGYDVVWAGNVKDFELDGAGNLISYVLEYDVYDRIQSRFYVFRKEVNRFSIRRFRDNSPISDVPNQYGFVPAEWVKHRDNGSDFGVPAIICIGKLDEINSFVSHTNDHVHKEINSPRIIWTRSKIKALFGDQETEALDESNFDTRRDQQFFKGDEGGNTETLVGNLDPATIIPDLDRMLREVEQDHPELIMYDKLRDQNIVSAPGASLLMGDVDKRVRRSATNYDKATIRLMQMGAAIGGWRLAKGDWQPSVQRDRFKPFNLDSIREGKLDMTLLPRPLIPPTTENMAEELDVRSRAVSQVAEIVPQEQAYRMLGIPEEEIPGLIAKHKAEIAERQAQALAQIEAEARAAAASKPVSGFNRDSGNR